MPELGAGVVVVCLILCPAEGVFLSWSWKIVMRRAEGTRNRAGGLPCFLAGWPMVGQEVSTQRTTEILGSVWADKLPDLIIGLYFYKNS